MPRLTSSAVSAMPIDLGLIFHSPQLLFSRMVQCLLRSTVYAIYSYTLRYEMVKLTTQAQALFLSLNIGRKKTPTLQNLPNYQRVMEMCLRLKACLNHWTNQGLTLMRTDSLSWIYTSIIEGRICSGVSNKCNNELNSATNLKEKCSLV